jgi:MFS family permease
VVNQIGPRAALSLGILGYAKFVACSLLYFLYGWSHLVVAGGWVLGFGAALLWTGQATLLLSYAAVAEAAAGPGRRQTGDLVGIFWAVYQCSALVGGSISFCYYNHERPSGSLTLYLIFLGFILLGAAASQLLLPPAMLLQIPEDCTYQHHLHATEDTLLLSMTNEEELAPTPHAAASHKERWRDEAVHTWRLFGSRPMLLLAALFFYTGLNQPYQQATFGNRFFTARAIGLELIVFHVMEIVAALVCGRALDRTLAATAHKPARSRRRAALQCLAVFFVVNSVGNALALAHEVHTSTGVQPLDVLTDASSLWPSLAFGCWGWADAQISVYIVWLLGAKYEGHDQARAIACYKCVQSLGYSVGFYLSPVTRLGALWQLMLSSAVFLVGTALSLQQLPR